MTDFGDNQMPGELASKLLTEQSAEKVAQFGPPLEPVVREFLEVLAEECAETIKRVTKILRFGMRQNPWNGENNRVRLESEVGDICAALDVLEMLEVISSDLVHAHSDAKLAAFATEEDLVRPRIRYMTPELRAKIAKRLK